MQAKPIAVIESRKRRRNGQGQDETEKEEGRKGRMTREITQEWRIAECHV